ncbi:MAG: hypothetical protein KAR38_11390 [Calditrichia bacterium]|nr:hypothetical protein [Calditrichia bacterium]
MHTQNKLITYNETIDFLLTLKGNKDYYLEFHEKKQKIFIFNKNNKKQYEIRLPLPFPSLKDYENLDNYIADVDEIPPAYYIVLIQAGNSSIGYFEEGEVIYHKVIRKYMVRKKQGKAQITYLNKKGKSRAGSRIRLRETMEFFEEINDKLNEWERTGDAEKILYSCPAKLWGMLFNSKIPPPFDKKDERLIKIPMDVNVPNFEELLRVNEFALCGEVVSQMPDA